MAGLETSELPWPMKDEAESMKLDHVLVLTSPDTQRLQRPQDGECFQPRSVQRAPRRPVLEIVVRRKRLVAHDFIHGHGAKSLDLPQADADRSALPVDPEARTRTVDVRK